VEKASISSAGAFTSTTIDATKLTGNLPAISGASLTNLPAGSSFLGTVINTATSITLTASDTLKLINVTASGKTITLPTAATNLVFGLINSSSDVAALVAPAGTETIGKFTGAMTIGASEELIVSCDGTNWKVIGDNGTVGLNVKQFSASGTYTPSGFCASFLVCVNGAGGGAVSSGYAGGGGGCGYSEKYYSSPASSYSLTIGAGSSGSGGATSFDVISVSGGSASTGSTGASGGSGSGGTYNATGGTGGNAYTGGTYGAGGGGGGSATRAGNGGNGGYGACDYCGGGGGGTGGNNASDGTAGIAATSENASVYSLSSFLTVSSFLSGTERSYGGAYGASSATTYTDVNSLTYTIGSATSGAGGGGRTSGWVGSLTGQSGHITIVEFY
jgi:hypothetical protein